MRRLLTSLISAPLLLLTLITAQAQVPPTFNTAPQYTGGVPFAIADFNLDGHPDIVSNLSTLLGNGDGTFRNGTRLNISEGSAYVISAADFNGDGKPDIAYLYLGGMSPQPIFIFLGNGDGTFQSPLSIVPRIKILRSCRRRRQ